MSTSCFLSFHYRDDVWRVSQIRNIGAITEQPLLSANDWEAVKKKGDPAIEKYIDDNMVGKKCLIVLLGEKTAGRRWVKYEIKKAWEKKLGLVAVKVHNLKDADGNQSKEGTDPFSGLRVDGIQVVGKVYSPPYTISTNVYDHIKNNIEEWAKTAIDARK